MATSSWTSNRVPATMSRRWRVASRSLRLMSESETLGGDFRGALEDITVPSYVIDNVGVIRWLNPAAIELVGDVRGLHFTDVVAPEDSRRARELFTRKILGAVSATEAEGVLLKADRTRVALEISAVPLKNGDCIVGMPESLGRPIDSGSAGMTSRSAVSSPTIARWTWFTMLRWRAWPSRNVRIAEAASGWGLRRIGS